LQVLQPKVWAASKSIFGGSAETAGF